MSKINKNDLLFKDCLKCKMPNLFCECDEISSTSTGRTDCSKPNLSNLPKTFGKTKLTKKQIGKRAAELKVPLKENYELLNALADGICYSGAEIPEELDFALYHLALAIDVLQDLRRNYR